MVIKEDAERGVRILRLANPPANVLNQGLLSALRREVAQAGAAPAVRCLVLASSYPRYFSTGLDLGELTSLPPDRQVEYFDSLVALYRELLRLPKPTLAAIGGSAILGGWILAMACDFRILSDDGRIALSEIRMGLTPTASLIGRLRQISSHGGLIKELVLRGKTLRAAQALEGGFVDRVVRAPELEAETLLEARALAKLPQAAYAAIKRALREPIVADDDALWHGCREEAASFFSRPDVQEGLAAMREKRRPRWEESAGV